MSKMTASLAVLGMILLAAPVASQVAEEGRGGCHIEGTWYGFNTFGETYIFTINKAKGKAYTAVGQAPIAPVPIFDFVIGDFPGTHGQFEKTGRDAFDTKWMSVSWIDPGYNFDLDLVFGGAGCGAGWDLMAISVFGPLTMSTCDTWSVDFDLEFIVYAFGTDPFVDGCSMGNPFGPGSGYYRRLQ